MELPPSLLQSELFGHAEGAFTGASRERAGLVESAGGGTFFLDEIGELPLPLQATLLRVLQEKEVRRLGESRRRRVDARFVFATNRELDDLVRRGRFRKDLYYRIAGARLRVPPLRMRREDVVPLARIFSRRRRRGAAAPPPRSPPTPSAARVVRMAGERAGAPQRDGADRRAERARAGRARGDARAARGRRGNGSDRMDGAATLPEAIARLQRTMIREALARHSGNRTRAAVALGVTRQGSSR